MAQSRLCFWLDKEILENLDRYGQGDANVLKAMTVITLLEVKEISNLASHTAGSKNLRVSQLHSWAYGLQLKLSTVPMNGSTSGPRVKSVLHKGRPALAASAGVSQLCA